MTVNILIFSKLINIKKQLCKAKQYQPTLTPNKIIHIILE